VQSTWCVRMLAYVRVPVRMLAYVRILGQERKRLLQRVLVSLSKYLLRRDNDSTLWYLWYLWVRTYVISSLTD